MWKKMLLVAMLFVAVGSFELSAQESATPPIVDQIVRKLGRGISNVAFGGLEFPLHWYQVNFEEGGLAATTYGILRGIVGNASFRTHDDKAQNRFRLATSYAFKSRDGQPNIDTLWLPVIAWEGRNISLQDLEQIEKGAVVYVEGRLRLNKFVTTEGVEKQSYEVIANYLRIEDEMAATQMA